MVWSRPPPFITAPTPRNPNFFFSSFAPGKKILIYFLAAISKKGVRKRYFKALLSLQKLSAVHFIYFRRALACIFFAKGFI